ncbi:MAG: protein containing domain [Parcubacteria group bacterium]|nr:protein containing domain [Parcubacteria group bacterium]
MLPKKYQGLNRHLMTKRSATGLGLFTKERIKKGEFIIEYTGTILNAKEANKKGGKYLFETSKNRFIDGTTRSNTARYINHSCAPNCEIDIIRGHVCVFSKRTIEPGEELFYDYEKEYFDEHIKPFGCKCTKCVSKNLK